LVAVIAVIDTEPDPPDPDRHAMDAIPIRFRNRKNDAGFDLIRIQIHMENKVQETYFFSIYCPKGQHSLSKF
jgi:hypothetical protein